MNWRLVLQLSLFGLAMGLATVWILQSTAEPVFWLAIFGVSAYVVGTRAPGRAFLHGLAVGIANSFWVTSAHVALTATYLEHHPQEAAMMPSMPMPTHPRLMMAMVGPFVGLVSGAIIGLLSLIVSRLAARRSTPASNT